VKPLASDLGEGERFFFELSHSGPIHRSGVVHPVLRLDSSHPVQSNLLERPLGLTQGREQFLGRVLDLDHRRTLSMLPRFAVKTAL
jgi:hypothetical protein